MKKVLHLVLVPILSGVQNVMIQILESLPDNEYEISVASAPGEILPTEVMSRGWRHIAIPSLVREINPYKDFKTVVELYNILKKEKFDIIHTHSSKTGLLGRLVGRLAGVPHVLHTIHGFPFHKYQNKGLYSFYLIAEMFAGGFCDYIISVNQEDAIFSSKVLRIPKDKVHFIPNGGIAQTEPLEIADKDRLVVGSLTRFWKQKNMLNTIKIAIKACKISADLDFIFVGDGEDYDACVSLVAEAGLNERIKLPGWSTEKEYWLRQFDVFMLYSLWEGLPLAILEAMSYGLPIVASDIKGNRELVNVQNGYLVDAEQHDNLLNCLLKLAQSRNLLKEKGIGSWKSVKEFYSLNNFQIKYLKLYRDLK
jgi:glycosyltransferase involved in cell wall biosynthesis